MNNKFVLILAGILIFIGFLKPDLNSIINRPSNVVDTIVVISPPSDTELKKLCETVIDAFNVNSPNKKQDARRLSDLYMDLATLIELDGDEEVVKTTEEVRQANSLSGVMLRLNLKGTYPELPSACQSLISSQIGDDMVSLDSDLRSKSANAFRALAWACNESSK
jgi:hypothetical protein